MATRPEGALFGSDDPLSITVEAVVRSVWAVAVAVVSIVVSACRHPVFTTVVAGLAYEAKAVGMDAALFTLGGVVSVACLWRVASPRSYKRWLQPRVSAMVLAPWYKVRWPGVASRLGLVVHDHDWSQRGHGGERLPTIRRVQVMSSGIRRLSIRLPHGLTPAMVAEEADGIAHALRCRDVRVVEHRPGRIWLELHRRDVLSSVIPPLRSPSRVDLSGVPIGRHEDGSDWALRVSGTHVLVAGATGSGKGSVLWSLLNGLAPALSNGTVQIWALDPKGGMELRPGRPLFTRFEDTDPEAMCRVLEQLVAVKDVRAKALAAQNRRMHVPSPESPHILLVVDELATLTAFAERVVVRRIEQTLGILLTQGRACGLTVLAAVQDPGKDVVVWRDLFPTRIAMRLDNPLQVDMVLGEGASDMGARADRISEHTPGVAFVRVEGTRALRRVRAAFVSDQDIPDVVRKGTRPTQPPGETTDEEGGEAA
jgi:S-DNA-T family DNA segregation ATPase FtsK/SpoIIIE